MLPNFLKGVNTKEQGDWLTMVPLVPWGSTDWAYHLKERHSSAQSGECFKDEVSPECQSAVAAPGTEQTVGTGHYCNSM